MKKISLFFVLLAVISCKNESEKVIVEEQISADTINTKTVDTLAKVTTVTTVDNSNTSLDWA